MKKDDCIFCNIPPEKIIIETELALAIYDKYPVNQGHMLVIPKRHFPGIFAATTEEVLALHEITLKVMDYLEENYHPAGYNIGINLDKAAGQTIFHLHIHVIPRYAGDVKNPRGGIRNLKDNIVRY